MKIYRDLSRFLSRFLLTHSELFLKVFFPGRGGYITYCWYGYVPPIWVGLWPLNSLKQGYNFHVFTKLPIYSRWVGILDFIIYYIHNIGSVCKLC